VKLTSDISVSNPAGTSETNSFQGTFDGDGHTLTFNQSGWTERYIAPFRFVGGTCTIKNLKTAGTISSSGMYATGLIAGTKDGSTITVENCISSMTLTCTDSGDKTLSGLVGRLENVTLTIRGCAFDGTLTGSSATGNAGFVSWIAPGCTVTITDCLFAPASLGTSTDLCATFARKDDRASAPTITGCYYTRPYGTAQGTEAIATTAAPRRLGALTKDYGMVKAYENGLQFNGMYYAAPAFIAGSGTEADPYIIGKADDWDTFASFVNSGTKDYSGLYVKLTSDISVTEMVGTDESHAFSGTFLGNGHTITATITGNEKQGTAPFSHINGATIKNLKVAGTITSNQNHAAALVGSSKGTCSIENCTVSATVNGNGYVGGIVGHSTDSNISISNCVFSGLLTGGGNFTGVFIGWGDGGTRSVTNCLYIMQDGQNTNHFDLVKDGGTLTVTNCYKTTDAGTFGVQVYTAVPDNEIYTSMTAVDNKAYYMTCVVSGVDKYYMYTGEAITVTPVVTTADGTVLTANTDYTYTISPEVVKEKGSYTLTITALGSTYIGTKTIAINVVDNLIVTSETTTMTSGRYQVFNDVTIASRITISGDVVLNLSEGTTLNAKKGIELGEGNTLTINGPGTLNIDGCEVGKSAIGARNWGTLVINGGTINAKGGFFGAGLGGDNVTGSGDTQVRCGSITINGGVVNAIGNEAVGIGGNLLAVTGGTVSVTGCDIVINGGQITASGGNIFPGIAPFCTVFKRDVCMVGTLTLGWTNPDDFVSSSSDNGKGVLFSSTFASITFAEGKQFLLEGTETIATAENYIGKKIVPYVVALADNADNSEVLSQYDGKQPSVVLSGRTLYKDGKWNTICLPFDVTLSSSPLDGAVARPLTAASIEGTTLNLTFGDAVTDLVAGTPYIIKWDGGDNIENPLFSGVTIDATDRSYDNEVAGDTRVRFIGTYKSIAFDAVDKSILLMGGASMLYTPAAGASIGAQRAYFKLGDGEALARRITAYNIDFGDSEATGILTTDFTDYTDKAGAWYDMQGRKLDGKPSRAGVYINKGIKVVIK